MDILFYCSFPPPYTGQTIATELIYNCLISSYSIDILNVADKNRFSRKSGDVNFNITWLWIRKMLNLAQALRKNKYKIVYVGYGSSKAALIRDFFSTWLIKKISNAKIIAHLHSGNYGENFQTGFFRYIFNKLMNHVDKLIFLSPMLNKLNNIEKNKVVYLSNMISEGVVCTESEIEQKFQIKNSKDVYDIFFISNMIEDKGYLDLLEAVKILHAKAQNFFIHFVGNWPSSEIKQAFISKIEAYGLKEITQVYGGIESRERIKQMFLEADIFVLPTYYQIEAQPLSIIEAFNAATPVISTYHASIPEMVQHGRNGYLVNKKSPVELAEKIQQLMCRSKWHEIAVNARHTYTTVYSKNVIIPRLFQIFHN